MNDSNRIILRLAALAALGLGTGLGNAGEELQPLAPGPGAYTDIGPATSVAPLRRVTSNDPVKNEKTRPSLRQNIVKLTLPSLGRGKSASRMKMVEASEDGPGGSLKFSPSESHAGKRQADIPGLVPPEVLAMAATRDSDAAPRTAMRRPAPITLPGALGTEELQEFNPFKDTPGTAEAFPAATHMAALDTATFRDTGRTSGGDIFAAGTPAKRSRAKKNTTPISETTVVDLPPVPVAGPSEWGIRRSSDSTDTPAAKQQKRSADKPAARFSPVSAAPKQPARPAASAQSGGRVPSVAPLAVMPQMTQQVLAPPAVINPPRSEMIQAPMPSPAAYSAGPAKYQPPLPDLDVMAMAPAAPAAPAMRQEYSMPVQPMAAPVAMAPMPSAPVAPPASMPSMSSMPSMPSVRGGLGITSSTGLILPMPPAEAIMGSLANSSIPESTPAPTPASLRPPLRMSNEPAPMHQATAGAANYAPGFIIHPGEVVIDMPPALMQGGSAQASSSFGQPHYDNYAIQPREFAGDKAGNVSGHIDAGGLTPMHKMRLY